MTAGDSAAQRTRGKTHGGRLAANARVCRGHRRSLSAWWERVLRSCEHWRPERAGAAGRGRGRQPAARPRRSRHPARGCLQLTAPPRTRGARARRRRVCVSHGARGHQLRARHGVHHPVRGPLRRAHQPRSRHSGRCGRSAPRWCRCRGPGRPRSRPAARSKSLVSTSWIRLANASGSLGVADAAREEAVAGEHVRVAVRVVVDQGDACPGCGPTRWRAVSSTAPDPDGVAVLDRHVGGHRDALGVVPARVGAGAGGVHHLAQRLPVVAVPVGGDDGRDAVVADQRRAGSPASLAASISSCSSVARQRSRYALLSMGPTATLEIIRSGSSCTSAGAADRHLSAVRHGLSLVPGGRAARGRG